MAAAEFNDWVQVEIDVYIPHGKYQVKLHSSPWFSAVCTAVIAHRNHSFHLYQHNKSSASKVEFRQASRCCKRVLETAKCTNANKTKEYITFQNLDSSDFWLIANGVFKACAYYFSLFCQMIALKKLWKCLMFHLKSFFLFSRCSNFCISLFFFPQSAIAHEYDKR